MRILINWASSNCKTQSAVRTPAIKRLQESRTVEISLYGLTRGVGLTPHSYSTVVAFGVCWNWSSFFFHAAAWAGLPQAS
jgi:hypothetical protein